MPNDGGRDLQPTRNPTTGQFSLFNWDATNNPTFDDSDSYTVLSVLLEEVLGYWADRTGRRGSTLYKIKLDVTGTAAQLKSAADRALAFVIERGLISSAVVSAVRVVVGRYDIRVQYKNRSGHVKNTRVPLGG